MITDGLEERVLFPALLSGSAASDVVQAEFAAMHVDHIAVGQILARIRASSRACTLPTSACNTYRALFAELEAMDGGVLRHVHLENHVLMPRCAAAGRLAGPLAQALAEDHRRLDELLAPAIDAMPLDAEARAPGGASSCATCNGDMQR